MKWTIYFHELFKNCFDIYLLQIFLQPITRYSFTTPNIGHIFHKEIALAKNKTGHYLLVAKSESGRILTKSLYNFALSYEQHMLRKWLLDKKATDFK
jgi:hypothetical protein